MEINRAKEYKKYMNTAFPDLKDDVADLYQLMHDKVEEVENFLEACDDLVT